MNEDNKKILQAVGIGLGVVAAIGAVAAILSNDTVQEKAEGAVNRARAKYIVNKHFNGNQKAIDAISDMSDEEINNILNTYDKLSNAGDSVQDTFESAKDNVADFGQQVQKRLTDFFVEKR